MKRLLLVVLFIGLAALPGVSQNNDSGQIQESSHLKNAAKAVIAVNTKNPNEINLGGGSYKLTTSKNFKNDASDNSGYSRTTEKTYKSTTSSDIITVRKYHGKDATTRWARVNSSAGDPSLWNRETITKAPIPGKKNEWIMTSHNKANTEYKATRLIKNADGTVTEVTVHHPFKVIQLEPQKRTEIAHGLMNTPLSTISKLDASLTESSPRTCKYGEDCF